MAVIVCDTTPLNYMILIDAVEILHRLYGHVLIPPAVRDELSRPGTPQSVRAWLAEPHSWIDVVNPGLDPGLGHLDAGESQAIALALELHAELLLLDDRDGVTAARERGLTVTGTLGVLDRAAALGWVDLPAMFARLRRLHFARLCG